MTEKVILKTTPELYVLFPLIPGETANTPGVLYNTEINLHIISFLKEELSETLTVRKKVVFIHQDQCCTSPLLEGLL